MVSFTDEEVKRVSDFLQNHMKNNGIEEMTADQCADLLAQANILPNDVGPKPGFNFRQMLRDGRDGKIMQVEGAYQIRPRSRWSIKRVK
jgi:hypothetical protein